MSDEGNAANDAASDGGDTEEGRESRGRTAVGDAAATPHRQAVPAASGGCRRRRSSPRTRLEDSDEDLGHQEGQEGPAAKKAKKPKKSGDQRANPFVFLYNYLKQVVAEMRKVIWPNRKQMVTYTSVVLAFLAFMVALVGLADFGLTKLVLLVFG